MEEGGLLGGGGGGGGGWGAAGGLQHGTKRVGVGAGRRAPGFGRRRLFLVVEVWGTEALLWTGGDVAEGRVARRVGQGLVAAG
jgi:hypothetical protein